MEINTTPNATNQRKGVAKFDSTQFEVENGNVKLNVDDTPVNGELKQPVSSNWAYDHVAAADPHTGYRLESADHTHASTGAQAGQLDHGNANTAASLLDDDHTQYLLAAGTRVLSADWNIGEQAIDLDETLSADGKYSGITCAGTAGATVVFGDLIYLSISDQRWELADASNESESGDVLLGMCLSSGNDGDAINVLLNGYIREDDWAFTSYGREIYASTTAGDITQTSPSGIGEIIRVIGYSHDDSDTIYFNPNRGYSFIEPTWYNASWLERLRINIPKTFATDTLTDFPFLITSLPDKFYSLCLATGADVVVTSSDGETKLKRELVSINTGNKTIELYVKTSPSTTADTVLWLYYDNAAGAETNDTDTWDSNFAAVYHMNDNPDTSTIQDSTVNNNDGTKKGANEPIETTGMFSGDMAQDFDGSNDYIKKTDTASLSVTTGITLEAFANPDLVNSNNRDLISKHYGADAYILRLADDNLWTVQLYDGSWASAKSNATASQGNWSYICGTWASGDVIKIYVNAVKQTQETAFTGPIPDTAAQLELGAANSGGTEKFDGKMAEVRISKTARPAAWILATYNNLVNNTTTYISKLA